MPDQAVVNASPLIFLAQADRMEFLEQVAPEILVPAVVAERFGDMARRIVLSKLRSNVGLLYKSILDLTVAIYISKLLVGLKLSALLRTH